MGVDRVVETRDVRPRDEAIPSEAREPSAFHLRVRCNRYGSVHICVMDGLRQAEVRKRKMLHQFRLAVGDEAREIVCRRRMNERELATSHPTLRCIEWGRPNRMLPVSEPTVASGKIGADRRRHESRR